MIEKALPAVMKRKTEIGGLCTCVPSVALEFRPLIEKKLAESLPTWVAAQ